MNTQVVELDAESHRPTTGGKDADVLAGLGYEQELERSWGFTENFGSRCVPFLSNSVERSSDDAAPKENDIVLTIRFSSQLLYHQRLHGNHNIVPAWFDERRTWVRPPLFFSCRIPFSAFPSSQVLSAVSFKRSLSLTSLYQQRHVDRLDLRFHHDHVSCFLVSSFRLSVLILRPCAGLLRSRWLRSSVLYRRAEDRTTGLRYWRRRSTARASFSSSSSTETALRPLYIRDRR
jgi:hypothetical protein